MFTLVSPFPVSDDAYVFAGKNAKGMAGDSASSANVTAAHFSTLRRSGWCGSFSMNLRLISLAADSDVEWLCCTVLPDDFTNAFVCPIKPPSTECHREA
jgi:hypothetical protein